MSQIVFYSVEILNRDSDFYQANTIHDSSNNNSNNSLDKFTNLGNGSLYHIFKCGTKQIRPC